MKIPFSILLIFMVSGVTYADCPHCSKGAKVVVYDSAGNSRGGYLAVFRGMTMTDPAIKAGDDLIPILDWKNSLGFHTTQFAPGLFEIAEVGAFVVRENIEIVKENTFSKIVFQQWEPRLDATAFNSLEKAKVKYLQNNRPLHVVEVAGDVSVRKYLLTRKGIPKDEFEIAVRHLMGAQKGAKYSNFTYYFGQMKSDEIASSLDKWIKDEQSLLKEIQRDFKYTPIRNAMEMLEKVYQERISYFESVRISHLSGDLGPIEDFLKRALGPNRSNELIVPLRENLKKGEWWGAVNILTENLFWDLWIPLGPNQAEGVLEDFGTISVEFSFD